MNVNGSTTINILSDLVVLFLRIKFIFKRSSIIILQLIVVKRLNQISLSLLYFLNIIYGLFYILHYIFI